jgi:hypothetical protein
MTINGRVETRKRLESDVILRCERKRASKDDVGDGMASFRDPLSGRRPSRAAELVIGPATSGRTRWRPPPGNGHSECRPSQIKE